MLKTLKPIAYLDAIQKHAKENYPAMKVTSSLAPCDKTDYLKLSVYDLRSSLGLLFEVRIDAMNDDNAARAVDSVALFIEQRMRG